MTLAIDVTALNRAEEVFIEFDFEPDRISAQGVSNAYQCTWDARPLRCQTGVLYTDEKRRIQFSFVPLVAGDISLAIRIGARNDRNASNDESLVARTVAAPTPSPPPPPVQGPPPSSGGGGGGG